MSPRILSAFVVIVLISFFMCHSDVPSPDTLARQQFVSDSIAKEKRIAKQVEESRKKENEWVNSRIDSMSKDEKLGQLFMVGAYPPKGASDEKRIYNCIDSHKIGGVIFFRGHEDRIASLTNKFQARSKFPMMMAMDAEWGTNMRVSASVKFPRQLMMGAIQNNALIYEFGVAVAQECKAMGIHINFAPVVDVNNNPANPVIGDRSFGENRKNVTAKSFQYIQGLQDNGIMACAKHFPGHGDTDVDSHKDLPVINHNLERLDSVELYPFKNLSQHGVKSVMVAHLHIPALDSTQNLPITLSKPAVTGLLKNKLGFKGLVFTDALSMKGVTKHFKEGEVDLKALLAGNDILLMTQDIPKAKKKIYEALDSNWITWEEINFRVRKILHAKYKMGLNEYKAVDPVNVVSRLNIHDNTALKQELVKNAITLIDDSSILPLEKKSVACISVGTANVENPFQEELSRYGVKDFYCSRNMVSQGRLKNLAKKDVVIVAVHNLNRSINKNFGISSGIEKFVKALSAKTKVLLVAFGTPYSLKNFPTAQAAVVAYNAETLTQKLTARAIAGALSFRGRLPVTASSKFRYGMGKDTEVQKMIYASSPEETGLDSKILARIDDIAAEMIRSEAAPGCQVLIAKDGKIAYHRTFGHYTYQKKKRVKLDNVYDIASVTKVAATTISIMRLVDEGLLDINQPLSFYLPELRGTNKSRITIKDILLHRAGLKPWIPFYIKTLDNMRKPIMGRYYATEESEDYSIRIAENLYFAKSKLDSILWQPIYDQELRNRKNYKYSDLGFYLFAKLIKTVTGLRLDEYVNETFYRPMGLTSMMFNPLKHGIPREEIIPTEDDNYFRYQIIQGDVHDMGAGMLDGVSGHAGLFSNAQDLAIIFQMLINGGEYGGKRYLQEKTVKKFTSKIRDDSRRGIGFDRKEDSPEPNTSINVAYQASALTFGHQGFTGIGAWGDPANNIVYLFLSNRTFPSGLNMTLIKKDIRSRIQEVVYEAIIPEKNNLNEDKKME
ncbi:MAG: serine hydrolase [Saprospiraceae bacterium]|nr:serine hydrolase [Saprospiraceae bacterium]